MAGDWIKMEVSTPDKAEVLAIAAHMGWDDPDLAVGKLFRVWRWFDQHTVDGNARGVTRTLFDRIAGVPSFSEAMESVGWLVIDSAGIRLPGFEKHCGKTAKDRAQTARRVATHRSNALGNGHGVTETDTPSLAREEKIREKKAEADASASSDSSAEPPGFARFWQAWPKSERKTAKAECCKRWKQRGLEAQADTIVAHVTAMAGTPKWREGFDPAPLTYLNQRRWEDGLPDVGYTLEQVAVFETYNSVLGAKDWPLATMEPFSPERAAAISQFLTFNEKPDFARRYFDHLAENLEARPGYGLDWTLRRDIYLRAREANFSFGGANGQ